MKRWGYALLGLSLLSGSCKKKTAEKPAVCREVVAGTQAAEVSAGEVPFDIWFLIMLNNFNRETMEAAKPVKDCTGREVRMPEVDDAAVACLERGRKAKAIATRPLIEEDLQITDAGDGQLLVWVKTLHYDNGEAEGPIAIAEFSKRGVLIISVGTLRAHEDKAAMRLEPLGEGKVLVIESRRCDPEDPKKCDRLTRLVPLEGGTKFVEKPLLGPKGECLGPPILNMFREQSVTLGDGRVRKFELSRTIDYTDGNVVIAEQLKIEDSDPSEPDAPPKVFRRAAVDRELTVLENGLKTKEGLWDKMFSEHGSVVYEAEKPPEEKKKD